MLLWWNNPYFQLVFFLHYLCNKWNAFSFLIRGHCKFSPMESLSLFNRQAQILNKHLAIFYLSWHSRNLMRVVHLSNECHVLVTSFEHFPIFQAYHCFLAKSQLMLYQVSSLILYHFPWWQKFYRLPVLSQSFVAHCTGLRFPKENWFYCNQSRPGAVTVSQFVLDSGHIQENKEGVHTSIRETLYKLIWITSLCVKLTK